MLSKQANSFWEFDGRSPMKYSKDSDHLFDLYMNVLSNGRKFQHHIKKSKFTSLLARERAILRRAKKFVVTNGLVKWIAGNTFGDQYYDSLENLTKMQPFQMKGKFNGVLTDMLPCFDNMFIEFCNDPFSVDNSQYTKVGFHITLKKNRELVYNFKRIYFDEESYLYQLPCTVDVDYLEEKEEKQITAKTDHAMNQMMNPEIVKDFYEQNVTSKKLDQFSVIYIDEVRHCMKILETLNYDWIEPRKIEEGKGKKYFGKFTGKGDVFETLEIDLPKSKGHQMLDVIVGVGSPKRRHEVRGHIRKYKDGKRVWIKSHERGDLSLGKVHKDYILNGR